MKTASQTKTPRNDMRHHIEVHASHREQVWESPSASLIEQDPEVIPDVDIAAQVGKDLFLDEKIPRHESGQGYVRILEKSIMWRETETAKVFTYQGLTTCTELDKNWTIMSSTYNHLRQGRDKGIDELKVFHPVPKLPKINGLNLWVKRSAQLFFLKHPIELVKH